MTTNRSEILSLRNAAPLGLGVAIGLALGAVALANVPAAPKIVPAPQQIASVTAERPLSAKPGISLARFKKDGERCVLAVVSGRSETVCAH